MPARGWLSLAAAVLAGLVLALDVVAWATQPPYVDLPLRPTDDVSEATLALDRSGIRWQIQDRGATLAVESARADHAIAALADEGLGPSSRNPQVRAAEPTEPERAERVLEARINAFLSETVGRDRAFASVDLTLNRDVSSETRLRYGSRATTLKREWDAWRLRGDFLKGAGRKRTTTWARDRAIDDVQFAPGRVRRISIGLVVDERVSASAAREIRRAVRGAAGIDRARGDVLRVSRLRIANRAGVRRDGGAADSPKIGMALIPWGLLVTGVALFLAEIALALRRRPASDTPPPWAAHRV